MHEIVVGAGAFGLYAAYVLAQRGSTVTILDGADGPASRASRVNQARLHSGYHYPRSLGTANACAMYHDRFAADFPSATVRTYDSIYAIAKVGSHTDAASFERFCEAAEIPAERVDPRAWFLPRRVEAAWKCREFGFDARAFAQEMLRRLDATGSVEFRFGTRVAGVELQRGSVVAVTETGERVSGDRLINATYAQANALLDRLSFERLPVVHELCELVLARIPTLRGSGITVMDGPFFSVTPFGHGDEHALSAVNLTPRLRVSTGLPAFPCQARRDDCSPTNLAECTTCPVQPRQAAPWIVDLAASYLGVAVPDTQLRSMFTVKTVLAAAEVDDARPTLVLAHEEDQRVVTVLSGKLNTVYDLETAL